MGSGTALFLIGVITLVLGAPGSVGAAMIAVGFLSTFGGWKITHAVQRLRSSQERRELIRRTPRAVALLLVQLVIAVGVGVLFVWLFTPTRTLDKPAVSPPPEP